MNLAIPLDHSHAFKMAIGAAKTGQELKAHSTFVLTSWSVVSALILSVEVTLLSMVDPDSVAERWHPWITVMFRCVCIVSTMAAALGPIILGNVLLCNCSACGVANFDLFLRAAMFSFQMNEVFTCIMCYGLLFSVGLLGFVVQDSLTIALAVSGIELVGIIVSVFAINTVTALNMYGGLFLEVERALPYEEFGKDSDTSIRGRRLEVIDKLVGKVREIKTDEEMVMNYMAARGRGKCEKGTQCDAVGKATQYDKVETFDD